MDSTETVLAKFFEAWSAKRLDEVVALFEDDGVYFSSVGPEPGKMATGHREIRSLVEAMFAFDQDSMAETSDPTIFEEGAFWTWKYTMQNGDVELGCDLLRVKRGRITLKDAYRKVKK